MKGLREFKCTSYQHFNRHADCRDSIWSVGDLKDEDAKPSTWDWVREWNGTQMSNERYCPKCYAYLTKRIDGGTYESNKDKAMEMD